METKMTKNILFSLSLLALTACGSADPAADGESVQIGDTVLTENAGKDSVTIQNAQGSLTASEGAAAAATKFPAHAPQYPGSTVTGAMTSGGNGKPLKTVVNITTNDSLEQIATFYRAKFAEQGMTLGMNMLADEAIMIDAKSGDKKAGVMAGLTEGKVNLSLTFSGE
jgi:hypothetical protein